jgi:hypothetical protein
MEANNVEIPTQTTTPMCLYASRSIASCSNYGGAERDRTADLLVANEALSQLSYSPPPKPASHTAFAGTTQPKQHLRVYQQPPLRLNQTPTFFLMSSL